MEDAASFLHSFIRPDFRPYAERAPYALASVGRLLERAGNPHRGLTVIHIAGSKGKGSTALMAEAILEATGRRTGTFTSPHLQRWTERFRVGGEEIAGERLAEVLEALRPHVETLSGKHPDNPPSFFDVLTAAAFVLFRESRVDCALVEVGIGGRYDATNVVEPAVSCITGIELEHADKLGDDLASIARHKAGIIKPAIPVIAAPLPPPAAAEISACAAAQGAPLLRLGREIGFEMTAESASGSAFAVALAGGRLEVELPVPGRHQAQNAALALACVDQLPGAIVAAHAGAARSALARVALPGRNELLQRAPWIVVDAAHTEGSFRALCEMLDALPARRRHLVLSLSSGREPGALCAPLLRGARHVTVTRAEPMRSDKPEHIAALVRGCAPHSEVRVESDPVRAIREAYRRLGRDDLLCATGSVYMAGLARTVLLEELALTEKHNHRGPGGHRVRTE